MQPDQLAARAVAISARGLRHEYDTAEGTITVLDGVALDIAPAEFVAVTGASGAGKTTLLSLIGGLERIQHGTIEVGDVDLGGLSGDALAAYRRTTIGFVFQDYGLLGTLTAEENVELALTFAGLPLGKRRTRARDLLDAVGLADRASHRPAALSGGESQRVRDRASPSPTRRAWSSPMNRPATSMKTQPTVCSRSCIPCPRSTVAPFWWSRTTR